MAECLEAITEYLAERSGNTKHSALQCVQHQATDFNPKYLYTEI